LFAIKPAEMTAGSKTNLINIKVNSEYSDKRKNLVGRQILNA